jgi:hypothetical protein
MGLTGSPFLLSNDGVLLRDGEYSMHESAGLWTRVLLVSEGVEREEETLIEQRYIFLSISISVMYLVSLIYLTSDECGHIRMA